MDCSPPGSSIHGIFQARLLEWVAECGRPGFNPWVRKIPWRRAWQFTSVFLPGDFHGQRSLVGYSPWGGKDLDMTEQLSLSHFWIVLIVIIKIKLTERISK